VHSVPSVILTECPDRHSTQLPLHERQTHWLLVVSRMDETFTFYLSAKFTIQVVPKRVLTNSFQNVCIYTFRNCLNFLVQAISLILPVVQVREGGPLACPKKVRVHRRFLYKNRMATQETHCFSIGDRLSTPEPCLSGGKESSTRDMQVGRQRAEMVSYAPLACRGDLNQMLSRFRVQITCRLPSRKL
jgi:hypothetical protein